ncbi:hypothetical protein ACRAWD_01180 [Caulobacter segnis]
MLCSIYICNEHRGYTAIDRMLSAIQVQLARGSRVDRIWSEGHRADERKHYLMFRRWFERRGAMPLDLDRAVGHIDPLCRDHVRITDRRSRAPSLIGRDMTCSSAFAGSSP